ncbi:uncharacterized protein LOC106668705 [Cimex lectularius]|uniref:Uncharacterized protein n=1 Tax=Cimex lectularius TaxID=79782 RepID=A0A8I6RXI2_CIMLE|nr:uncharacterized protein LOC106668705 [Cimex lectularius]
MPCDNKAFLKGVQVAICTVALIFKVMTTWEADRVNHFLQKQSREWTGASYTHATSLTSIFMDITFGGFLIICLCQLVGHVLGDPKTKSESMMMVIGFLMMAGSGGILVSSIDDVPDQLYDNTIVLAVLALIGGVLFLTDAGTKCARKERPKKLPARSKRDIVVIPKQEEKKEEEVATVEQPTVEHQREEQPKETPPGHAKSENGGISSVQIRIKDPKKNWAVYGDMPPRSTSELDVLAEAEVVDRMLTRGEHVAMTRSAMGQVPDFKQSPLRHTSSFYITPTPHFAWKRLSEKT